MDCKTRCTVCFTVLAFIFPVSVWSQTGPSSLPLHSTDQTLSVWDPYANVASAFNASSAPTLARSTSPFPEFNGWEFLPQGNLYPSYLADNKASRMALKWAVGDDQYLEGSLGARFGLLRLIEPTSSPWPRGIQIDVEGAALLRLNGDVELEMESADFRVGIPVSVSFGQLQTRFGYYHLSSHLGDEFLLRNPTTNRLNFSRDVLFLGAAYWCTPATRVYAEAGWSFYEDISEQWELMFGFESLNREATGIRGTPFFAAHVHLREELDFGGHVNLQAGWAWRRRRDTGTLRAGLFYTNGKSSQFSFFQYYEQLLGLGMWYDF